MKKFLFCFISTFLLCSTYVYAEDDILFDPIVDDKEDFVISENVISEPTTETFPEPTSEPTSEPTPEPTPEIYSDTLSGNELLKEILITNKEIEKDVKIINESIINNRVSDSVLSDNSISDNLINKPLSEYDLKESLLLFIALLAISAGLVYIIHKSIFKWG